MIPLGSTNSVSPKGPGKSNSRKGSSMDGFNQQQPHSPLLARYPSSILGKATTRKSTMAEQTNQPKPSIFRRALCACGFHSWEDVEPNICCSEDFFGIYDPEFYWRKCKHCGLEEDLRCDVCKKDGTVECNRRYREKLIKYRRKDKTVHCCSSCKCQDSEL